MRTSDFYVYSRQGLAAARPHEVPHIVISITSSVDDVARLPENTRCRGTLRLAFPDAAVASEVHAEGVLFSREQALDVWRFVRQHLDGIERIVVHCDAGMSRSPALAAALSKILAGDDAQFFGGRYRPNERVYRMVLDAVEE